jgi:cell division protein ZapB
MQQPSPAQSPAQDTQLDIGQLERQVEALIEACLRLRSENSSLRQRQESLVAEKAELIEKTELARSRVEAMITRLKAMEHGL